MRGVLFALLLVASSADAAYLPRWVRIITSDGQVIDYARGAIESVVLCPVAGSKALREDASGTGVLVVNGYQSSFQHVFHYELKFYNAGASTDNPNTTGDQALFVQSANGIFASEFADCVVNDHYEG